MKLKRRKTIVRFATTLLSFALTMVLLLLATGLADGAGAENNAAEAPGPVYSPEFQEWSAPVCGAAPLGAVRCHAWVIVDETGRPLAPKGAKGYGPAQLLGAYGLSGTAAGAPIIAIVGANDDPTAASDLNYFSNTYGIPELPACPTSPWPPAAACFRKTDQNGGENYPPADWGWAVEFSLDLQTAHSICQNCVLVLVEANSSDENDVLAAIDEARSLGAKAISNSWGGAESHGELSWDSHFDIPGVAITFSAGDNGYGAVYPAASPYVTAVGGTTLTVDGDNQWVSETAWHGTGSGCSKYEPPPEFQTALGLPGCAFRMVADVSADADPSTGLTVYDSTGDNGHNGWMLVGGTSMASPLIAAVYALGAIDADVMANSVPYASVAYGKNLHDIVSGSNGSCAPSYLCHAVAGYDGPTGLGTPLGVGAFGVAGDDDDDDTSDDDDNDDNDSVDDDSSPAPPHGQSSDKSGGCGC
jgi:hypothetical protein